MADMSQFTPLGNYNRSDENYGRQFRMLTRNIRNTFNNASPDQVEAGKLWYPKAHDQANIVGSGDTKRGAGVIAALSPMTEWGLNLMQAHQFKDLGEDQINAIKGGDRSSLKGTPLNSNYTANILKAHKIYAGEVEPEDALPMDIKTGNFYKNILDPSDPNPVTIDRHAHDAAIGRKVGSADRGLGSKGRYQHFADAYHQATKGTGLNAGELQATVWTKWLQDGGPR